MTKDDERLREHQQETEKAATEVQARVDAAATRLAEFETLRAASEAQLEQHRNRAAAAEEAQQQAQQAIAAQIESAKRTEQEHLKRVEELRAELSAQEEAHNNAAAE